MLELDIFPISHIFSFLDQKSRVRMTSICKKFVMMREHVHSLTASTMLLIFYKNLIYKLYNI